MRHPTWHRHIAFILVLAFAAACNPSVVQTEYRVLGATVHTVDLAMKAWAEYVHAGHATAEQEAAVRSGYETYQKVAIAAKVALLASSGIATPPDLVAAAQAIVSIIEIFTHKKVVVTP